MEEFGFWTGFGSGLYLGASLGACAWFGFLLCCALMKQPQRNYGVPKRDANVIQLDQYRRHA